MDESGLEPKNKVVYFFYGESTEITFLHIVCLRGKIRKWSLVMPPGSAVVMNQKSAYMNFFYLMTGLKPNSCLGNHQKKNFYGYASHCGNVEMLEFAKENEIIVLGLPSHSFNIFCSPLIGAYEAFLSF